MNSLFNHIPSESFRTTYETMKRLLDGNEQLVFDAMAEITQRSQNQFISTNDPSQFERKYREMERRFVFRSTLAGVEICLNMMARVYEEVVSGGSVDQLQPHALLGVLVFETNRDFQIRLSESLCWAIVWTAELNTPRISEEFEIAVDIHRREWGQVVPVYVVEYLDSAISAYNRGMYAAALALLSIVVEATLRGILSTIGYTFQAQAAKRRVRGLGAALDIARTQERIIAEEDLTPDFDGVIQAVRNNLVHLSSDALNTHLPDYDNLTPGRQYLLRDFLRSPEMVFDLVNNVPQFVNEQYFRLRQTGHLLQ